MPSDLSIYAKSLILLWFWTLNCAWITVYWFHVQRNGDYEMMTTANLRRERMFQIETKVKELLEKAKSKFLVEVPPVRVYFDLRGRAAGQAGVERGSYYLRFNPVLLRDESFQDLLEDTVPHEVAHLVCFKSPLLGRNHDGGWKRVCRVLGGTGERCHKENLAPARKTVKIVYTATCGTKVPVGKAIHRRIQQGMTYTVRKTAGKIDRQCQYSLPV